MIEGVQLKDVTKSRAPLLTIGSAETTPKMATISIAVRKQVIRSC